MAISGEKKCHKISTAVNFCTAIFTNKFFTLSQRIIQSIISPTVIINEQLKKAGYDGPRFSVNDSFK